MSGSCLNIINPLRVQREGSDQKGRTGRALMPEYAPVDARTEAHDLVLARNLAAAVIYYDQYNRRNGSWRPFFDSDLAVLLAKVSLNDPAVLKDQIFLCLSQLKDDDVSDAEKKVQLTHIFRLVINLAGRLDDLCRKIPSGHQAFVFLQNLIEKLVPFYKRMVSYYKAAEARGLIDESAATGMKIFGEPAASAKVIIIGKVFLNPAMNIDYTALVADDSIWGAGALPVSRQIFLGSSHNFFSEVIHRFLQVYGKVIHEMGLHFVKSMQQPDHQPHMALFLAFTKMMGYAREHVNTFTTRHLDLYYRDILKLKEQMPQASQVHLLIEAARHIENFLLKKGTLLKAGKNAAGGDVLFATDEDLVVSHATITGLKSLYRATETDDANRNMSLTTPLSHRLFARQDLSLSDASVNPLASKTYHYGKLSEISMEPAEIGFAVASHYLFLNESSRTITLTLEVSGLGTLPADVAAHFKARITTEKAWTDLLIESVTSSAAQLIFVLKLSEKDPATTPWSDKTHGGQYQSTMPLLEISLQHLENEPYLLKELYKAEVQKVQLKVAVTNIRNLFLRNDTGGLDASKPFMPFGANPKAGAGFVIGNQEVFQKKSNLKINWPSGFSTYGQTYKILEKGTWVGISPASSVFTLQNDHITEPAFTGNEPLDALKTEGYLKVLYAGGFETTYNNYLKTLVTELKKTTPGNLPAVPVPPLIETISLNYDATVEVELNNAASFAGEGLAFFHKYPFGVSRQHKFLNQQDIYLLPGFRHNNFQDPFFTLKNKELGTIQADEIAGLQPEDDFSGEAEHEAEFYFGVQGLKIPGFLSVLCQLDDGTANPMTAKPEHHVHWSYLGEKDWISFKKGEVFDKTMQLTRSGIIGFSIPEKAVITNTMMPLGQYWIRASVTKGAEAVCKLVRLAPNAISATLLHPEANGDLLGSPLPAGTIAKLLNPLAEVKKVEQPFDGFGGRGREKSTHYYRRVSERLRHKDRAVAAWDYEKMVLERFPSVYKVKCLHHTLYDVNASGNVIYNEMSPGHVTLITVPDLRERNLINPLRPFVSLEVTEQIRAYLVQHTSAFAVLHVKNPVIEEIRLSFRVSILAQYDESFCTQELKREITRYLSPWAFDASNELVFGGQVEKSAVINFIEERPYVDYITDVKLYHRYADENGNPQEIETETAKATKGASILVSVPAEDHLIDAIALNIEETDTHSCGC